MIVCIAEKPSVAREIAQVLKATVQRDGFYEGNGYAITYTFGHFCTLFEPKDYKPHWKSWDLNNLPMLPEKFETKIVEDQGIQKQFKIIQSLFDKASLVINCGDAGQEGELIQRWVIQQAQFKGQVKRLWISSLTTEAILDGFNNLRPAEDFDNLYYAGISRAIGDWLLGLNATRLYTLKYGGHKQVISIGRVQTPTLTMVVERFLEIKHFQPQPYWDLKTIFKNSTFHYELGRFLTKSDGEKVVEIIRDQPFQIKKISTKKGNEYAPKLFDLTSLQVYCNTKFGFTADETLKIVQKLYEQKLVTYPRVDTVFLPEDMYPKIAGILKNLTAYSALTQNLLTKKIKKSIRVFNNKKVTDHHAIIPTGIQGNLSSSFQQIYDSITRRFIAAFYDECKVSNTTIIGDVVGHKFKTKGKQILDKGWKVVFEFMNENPPLEEKILPHFVQDEKGSHNPTFEEKKTSPPKYFTEATLLRAMETAGKSVADDEMRDHLKENGIGRPSTRASIIETLFKRKYIVRKKKLLIPTETGIQLVSIIRNKLLKSAELTGAWEKQLKQIEAGDYSARLFISNMKKMVDTLVYEVRSEKGQLRINASNSAPPITEKAQKINNLELGLIKHLCPKCNQGILLKGKNAFGCNRYTSGCDFVLPFSFLGKKISESQYLRLIKKGATINLKGFEIQNEKLAGKVEFDSNFRLKFVKKEPQKTASSNSLKCPKCGIGSILKGSRAYGCTRYRDGCDFVYPFDHLKTIAGNRKLTKELVIAILNGQS